MNPLDTSHRNTAKQAWKPQILDPQHQQDRQALKTLLNSDHIWRLHDTLKQQVEDLVRTRHPQWVKKPASDAEVKDKINVFLNGVALQDYGRWVYYPWSGNLVHLLPPQEFQAAQTGLPDRFPRWRSGCGWRGRWCAARGCRSWRCRFAPAPD